MRPEDILVPTPSGVCCKPGGFHIDPTRPVEKALITHGHSDHARAGHGAVLATQETLDIMRLRYGENFAGTTQAIRSGESLALFPERAHLVGAYSLGKAQRVIALIRAAGHDKTIYLHGAMEKITRYYEEKGIRLGPLERVAGAKKADLAGHITLCPPSAPAPASAA